MERPRKAARAAQLASRRRGGPKPNRRGSGASPNRDDSITKLPMELANPRRNLRGAWRTGGTCSLATLGFFGECGGRSRRCGLLPNIEGLCQGLVDQAGATPIGKTQYAAVGRR